MYLCATFTFMEKVTYQGLDFVPFIKNDAIQAEVKRVAAEITRDYAQNPPLFLCVLTGAFVFAADLFRNIPFDAEITFIRFKSYEGMKSTGQIKEVIGLHEDITDRPIVIIEDIVDTGTTAAQLIETLKAKGAKDVRLATLLFKPDSMKTNVKPDYVCFNIPSKFILGYGLDIDGFARNLPDIYILKENA